MRSTWQCAASGCDEPAYFGNYCRFHYDRARRHGTVNDVLRCILCPQCHMAGKAERPTARFCSDRCRKAWHRQHPGRTPPMGRFYLAEVTVEGKGIDVRQVIVRQRRTRGPDDTPVPDTEQW